MKPVHDSRQTIEGAVGQIIREHEQIVLGPRDGDVFHDALVNPPKITKRIQKAFKAHDRLVRRTVGG